MSLEQRIATSRERIAHALAQFQPAAFSTSFSAEDMVVLDLLARAGAPCGVFTLDTGRLPEETQALMHAVRRRYALPIKVYMPHADELEQLVAEIGPNGFYDSVDARQRCCAVRKLHPLARALQGHALWITGLRRAQSTTRSALDPLERDEARGLIKLNPIVEWTRDDVWAYVERFDVPVNALHRRGFPSIGCAPCTRAVAPGEDERAGRWWWEAAERRECGLHIAPDGRVMRARPASGDAEEAAERAAIPATIA